MKISTRTQFISALIVATAWGCSSEPTDEDATMSGAGTANGGSAGSSAGSSSGGASGSSTAGTAQGGSSGAAVGGTAGVAGGTAGVGGGAGGTAGAGGATAGAGGGGADCPELAGVQGHPDCSVTYPTYPGFTLALVEEFNAPLDLVNDPIWTYSDGGLDEGIVRFLKDNITFEAGSENNGVMKLNFLDRVDDPVAGSFSHAEEKEVGTKDYSSGELRTKYNNYRYGRYEMRMKAPSVTTANPDTPGGYVATLFIFRTPKFTNWREIDIEQTGYSSTSLTTNLINGNNRAGWAADFASAQDTTLASSGRTEFHTYAFEWTAGRVDWFVDDNPTPFRTDTGGGIAVPDMSAKIMMNLWTGAFGGDASQNEYPMATEYDWFRFYKWDMDDTYPTANPAVDLPAADRDGSKNNPEDGVEDIPPNDGD